MTAGKAASYLALLLFTSALLRLPKLYHDLMKGAVDLTALIALRFEVFSAGMLFLLASALPR
ncbi:hypothetical protein [Bradyrhizobium sp. 33ap4]|uniref:hypothetical protein n=1 Tax=Bradyrhizobium sp. 33ap4 TaxID=3061630 RepID=UPI00293036EA|nr:hypothetical protein [Bradyrhizobium sp. 33ap4]